MLKEIGTILGLDHTYSIVLVGVGHIGQALTSYSGFARQGFEIKAAFDTDSKLVGKQIGALVVRNIAENG